jgi:hypothetical protein
MKKKLQASILVLLTLSGLLSAWNLPFPALNGLNQNNNNLSLKNQFIFSMSSAGNSTMFQNSFLQSLTWKIQGPWSMTLDYSLNTFSSKFEAGTMFNPRNITPLGSVRVNYDDGKKSSFFVRYGNFQPEFSGTFDSMLWTGSHWNDYTWNDPNVLKQNFLQLYYHTTVFNGFLDLTVSYANPIHTP